MDNVLPFLLTGIFLCAGLGYYIGCILVATPHAHKGLRIAGFEMIGDAGVTIFLTLFLMSFYWIYDLFLRMLFPAAAGQVHAGDYLYSQALGWIEGEKSSLFFVMLGLNIIPILLRSLEALGFFGIFSLLAELVSIGITPWMFVATIYTIAISLLSFWAKMIQVYWPVLLFFGAFMYSWPKRIGRMAGGWMMATALGYYIATPFIGWFVDGLTGTTIENSVEYQRVLQASADTPQDLQASWALISACNDFGAFLVVRFTLIVIYLTLTLFLSRSLVDVFAGVVPPKTIAEPEVQ